MLESASNVNQGGRAQRQVWRFGAKIGIDSNSADDSEKSSVKIELVVDSDSDSNDGADTKANSELRTPNGKEHKRSSN